jgi:tetratricopeptide (TPR) repeat protein
MLAGALSAQAQSPDAPAAAPANSALDGALFYQLLLGELTAQGGDPGTGYALLLDAARKTNDTQLYKRATDIALQARAGDSALQAARAWRQAQPASRQANRYLLEILIALNRLSEAAEPLKREVALADAPERVAAINLLPGYFARASDKKLAAQVLEQALADQLDQPATGAAAWTSIGRLRLIAGDVPGTLEAARRGNAVDAKAEGPALLALALTSVSQPQAETLVRQYLDAQPQSEVRLEYARILLNLQRYSEAYEQLRLATRDRPQDAPAWLLRGTLELQERRLGDAETSIKRYVALLQANTAMPEEERSRGLAQAYLQLSQIAEQRRDYAQANRWLDQISNAQDMVSAQSRRAALLAREGKLEEGRQLIRRLPERNPGDARLKLSAEVQLLRDNKQYQTAYDLLERANRSEPVDVNLLYDQATLAEKLDRADDMERLLRQIIAIKPDYHHAYNALGYFFADRNIRLEEARLLILKALEFAPGDPFIADSLGWVEFRRGNTAEALRILQEAYRKRPDAEIAAHLGEVLWSLGQREQAMSVWKEGLNLNAENETLQETIKRLRAPL